MNAHRCQICMFQIFIGLFLSKMRLYAYDSFTWHSASEQTLPMASIPVPSLAPQNLQVPTDDMLLTLPSKHK